MNYEALRRELKKDVYVDMSDEAVLGALSAVTLLVNRDQMDGGQLLDIVNDLALAGFNVDDRADFWGLVSITSFDPFGFVADVMKRLFGETSDTWTAYVVARRRSVSAAESMGFEGLRLGDVQLIRRELLNG